MSRNKWNITITRSFKDLCKKIAFENFVLRFFLNKKKKW